MSRLSAAVSDGFDKRNLTIALLIFLLRITA